MRKKLLITSIPFGTEDNTPLKLLEEANIEYIINPFNQKFTDEQLIHYIKDVDYVIAGTDKLSIKVLDSAKKLKLISRLGIGLDSVDLLHAKSKGIRVAYTPDGPTNSVAEYTLCLILLSMRQSYRSNIALRDGVWKKFIGTSIEESKIGIFGAGRIGREVIRLISIFNPKKIMVYDPFIELDSLKNYDVTWAEKDQILNEANLISIHLPLSDKTRDFFVMQDMKKMLRNTILVNTSRGGIINEKDLYIALEKNIIGGAAIDVFDVEPYTGNLGQLDNCFVSAHMSPMSSAARKRMELDTVMEVINYAKNGMLYNEVPGYEYQKRVLKG